MNKTSIEWADYVWNPVTGCTKVSEGCRNCYAEAIARRFWGERKFTDVMCHPERLDQPMKTKKGGRVFVNSMSDLFHPDVPDGFISAVWSRIITTPQHTYIILTKRPERMANLVPLLFREWPDDDPVIQPNVHLGVSVSNQPDADKFIPWLLRTPAAARIVSVEPMLEKVDLWQYLGGEREPIGERFNGHGLDQVICGCESGPNRRPMNIDWARSLRNQCTLAGVPFFLKQMEIGGKLVKMPALDGRVWDQYPVVAP